MNSFRNKSIRLTIMMIVIAVVSLTAISVVLVFETGNSRSDNNMLLLCELGEKNLNYYFVSVQKSISKVASFAEEDLSGLEDEQLEKHIAHVGEYFDEISSKTNGVLTYYYRIDPAVSDKVKGFWFTKIDGNEFTEHEVTDISKYDTEDTSQLVWFTVPKKTGNPMWLPTYVTDNLDKRVISYNIPVFFKGEFVGVVGIEIDYTTISRQVESIRLYKTGYAFLCDAKGNLIVHPHIDAATITDEQAATIPAAIKSNGSFFEYEFEGVRKQAVWLSLSNGMRLTVTVPVSEVRAEWMTLVSYIIFAALFVMTSTILLAVWASQSGDQRLQR